MMFGTEKNVFFHSVFRVYSHSSCFKSALEEFVYVCAMQILDGKKASQSIKDVLAIDVAQRANEGKKIPHLAAILVGENGASETYVAAKVKACEEVGFKSTL